MDKIDWLGVLTGIALVIGALGKILQEVRAGNRATEKVKILVDGSMTIALKRIAKLSKGIARLTKDPDDVQAAEDAQKDVDIKVMKDKEAHKGGN